MSIVNDKLDRLLIAAQRLEYFSNGTRATYIGDNRVLVRVVVGDANIAFIVEANDRLLSPWLIATGSYETELTDYLVGSLRKDSHCLDLGANFGYFTCLMGRFCPQGKVIGVEADRHVYELARDNVAINNIGHLASARHAAVSDSQEPVTLYRRNGRAGNTSIAFVSDTFTEHMGESPVTAFSVAGLRVDDLLAEFDGRLDVMKVDAPGLPGREGDPGAQPAAEGFDGMVARPDPARRVRHRPVHVRAGGRRAEGVRAGGRPGAAGQLRHARRDALSGGRGAQARRTRVAAVRVSPRPRSPARTPDGRLPPRGPPPAGWRSRERAR